MTVKNASIAQTFRRQREDVIYSVNNRDEAPTADKLIGGYSDYVIFMVGNTRKCINSWIPDNCDNPIDLRGEVLAELYPELTGGTQYDELLSCISPADWLRWCNKNRNKWEDEND